MGQAQSQVAADDQRNQDSANVPDQPGSSLEDLIAEAAAFGDDENGSLDDKVQKALDCPCVADLRSGPCGMQFTEAFACFLKSTAEEKGSDCVHPFVALQNCIKANPDAFSKDVLEEESKKDEEEIQDHKIIPPTWSKEPRPKL